MSNNAIEVLSKYGTVRTCKKVHDDVVTIVLTHGFTENGVKTIEFLKKCQELFPEHSALETCLTEENCAIVVLTKQIT